MANNASDQVTATEKQQHAITTSSSEDVLTRKFNGSSTADDVLNGIKLNGKYAVVTGATSGIGFETARALAAHGCSVGLMGRDTSRGEHAIQQIKQQHPDADIKFLLCDLESLASVKTLCDQLIQEKKPINILVLNAGVFGAPFKTTVDGFESQFQVNHLSQMYMTLRLKPILSPQGDTRIIVLSSESHRGASLTTQNITHEQKLSPGPNDKYSNFMIYNNSKLCNVLFTRALNQRWHNNENQNVTVFAVHPGNMISTGIQRHWWVSRAVFAVARVFTKTVPQGAATTVWAAVTPQLAQNQYAGSYLNNCWICEPSTKAKDAELAELLWKTSLGMLKGAGYPCDEGV